VIGGFSTAQRHAGAEAERQAAEKNQTFRQVAESYLATRNWRRGTLAQARHKFPKYIYPKLGDVPISSIDVGHLEGMFRPILDQGLGATASQIHMFVSAILEYAGRSGGDNPARLKGLLGRRLPHLVDARAGKGARGNPYLDYKRIGECMAALRAFRYQHWVGKTPIPARALEFLILTAVRIDQVTSLPWNEIDWEEKLWVCPPERHKVGGKTNMDYIVPLSDQAMRVLEEMHKLQQDCGLYSERGFVFVHGLQLTFTVARSTAGPLAIRSIACRPGRS
jgi:integrase